MISKKIEKAFNAQINAELYSAYLYEAMAMYFESENLGGFANWMNIQAQEELTHAMKFCAFVNERGGRVKMAAIEAPPAEWDGPTGAFGAVLNHEQKVSALINDLVDLAIAEKDHAANNFLQWFVAEQVEEEKSADEILQKAKRMIDAPGGLYMLDEQLAQRVFAPPTAEQQ